jgi:hypothetical protein
MATAQKGSSHIRAILVPELRSREQRTGRRSLQWQMNLATEKIASVTEKYSDS